jgi:aminoglycoside 3-N-acetyltransferase
MDLMVHSALAKVGMVAGGAATVIAALRAAIGPRGTLLIPSFNHGRVKVFNPLASPSTNGTIPDAAWRRPDAVRSLHPTHAVCAFGPKAEAWLAGHLAAGAFGPDSPIGRLIRGGGYLLGLGSGLGSATTYHLAEVSMPCRSIDLFGRKDRVVMPDGSVQVVPGIAWRERPCPAPLCPELDRLLDRRGLLRRGRVGQADCWLVRADDFWRTRRDQLRRHCPACRIQPKYGQNHPR